MSTPGLWNGELGEALLDDLYNRTDQVKVAAAAALLPNADGEFKDHLREVLRFQLDAEDANDATLIQLARKKAAEPEDPAEGQ
ncbi:MAG: hypothetical protein JWO82_3251 [Akkermansiaceae bacterium]|nr:hypothetical protein [Akkermansiaceae bacterium]